MAFDGFLMSTYAHFDFHSDLMSDRGADASHHTAAEAEPRTGRAAQTGSPRPETGELWTQSSVFEPKGFFWKEACKVK